MKKLVSTLVGLTLSLFLISGLAMAKPQQATVIYIYQDGCGACQKFNETVLSDAGVQKELEHFNFRKETAQSTKYKVDVTPTIIILKDNKTHTFQPQANKAKFIETLRKFK